MRRRDVIYLESAKIDLKQIGNWLAEVASEAVADRYVTQITERLATLAFGSQRGSLRSPDSELRVSGVLKSVAVAFVVTDEAVYIHRILYRGKPWDDRLLDDADN